MWMKYGLLIVLAVCLLPDDVHSHGICEYCKPYCSVQIQGHWRRLDYYNGNMYYFASDASQKNRMTWIKAHTFCLDLFRPQNGWHGSLGILASFHSRAEFDFIWNKMNSFRVGRSFIGGIKIGNEWKWVDGTPLNKDLISGLWEKDQPDGDGIGMELLDHGLNDLPLTLRRKDMFSWVCKIPCAKQCHEYKTLSEVSRSVNQPKGRYCDGFKLYPGYDTTSPSWTGSSWYKFVLPAGTKMATKPPPVDTCGTRAPGFMTTEHPSEIGQTKSAKFCFNWAGDTCWKTSYGEVTKCGEGDFVYKLPDVAQCTSRYCAVP